MTFATARLVQSLTANIKKSKLSALILKDMLFGLVSFAIFLHVKEQGFFLFGCNAQQPRNSVLRTCFLHMESEAQVQQKKQKHYRTAQSTATQQGKDRSGTPKGGHFDRPRSILKSCTCELVGKQPVESKTQTYNWQAHSRVLVRSWAGLFANRTVRQSYFAFSKETNNVA